MLNGMVGSGAYGGNIARSESKCADWLSPDVIHIGYQKVWSTFFQHSVFPALADQLMFLRKAEVRFADGAFTTEAPDLEERLRAARGAGRRVLVSQENLAAGDLRDQPELAAQLRRVAPGALILLFVRSQYSILRSAYFLALKAGYDGSYVAYIKAVSERKYHYDRMLQAYREQFGAQRVHVVLHEDLKSDFQNTLHSLLDFIGYRYDAPIRIATDAVRKTPSDIAIDARRPANFIANRLRLGKRGHDWLQTASLFLAYAVQEKVWRPLMGHAINYRDYDAYRERVRQAYAGSNERFFGLLARNAASLDYPQ